MEEGRAWDVVQSGLGIAGYACGQRTGFKARSSRRVDIEGLLLKGSWHRWDLLRSAGGRDRGIFGLFGMGGKVGGIVRFGIYFRMDLMVSCLLESRVVRSRCY